MADTDDGSIDGYLYRRVRPDQIVFDQNLGRRRPSSAAFKNPDLSTDAAAVLSADGLDWHFSLEGYPGYSLVQFTAAFCRGLGLPVIHKPLPENRAHTEVHGKKRQPVADAFVRDPDWVHLEPES
jgi:hypothetical protein